MYDFWQRKFEIWNWFFIFLWKILWTDYFELQRISKFICYWLVSFIFSGIALVFRDWSASQPSLMRACLVELSVSLMLKNLKKKELGKTVALKSCKFQGLNLSKSYFCPIFQNRVVLKHRSLKYKVLNHSIIQSLSCLLIILSIFDESEKLRSQNWILKIPGSSQENRKYLAILVSKYKIEVKMQHFLTLPKNLYWVTKISQTSCPTVP